MPTAHLYRLVQDTAGNVLTGASITICDPGSSNPVSVPIYIDEQLSQSLSNPFVSADGTINLYMANQMTVAISVQYGSRSTIQDYVDVLPNAENILTSTTPLTITNDPFAGATLQVVDADTAQWVDETEASAVPVSAFQATGDLLVGTGTGTFETLAVSGSSDGNVFTLDHTQAGGVKWAPPAGTGTDTDAVHYTAETPNATKVKQALLNLTAMPTLRPEQFGAKADGTTDDSLAFYQAIQTGKAQAAGSGCYIQLQQGAKYYIGQAAHTAHSLQGLIDLDTGVYMGVPGGSGRAATGATTLIGDHTFIGYVVDTVNTGVQGCGINGILVISDMSSGIATACGGVRFQVVEWGHIKDVGIGNVSDIGLNILGCIDMHLENIGVSHNVSGRTLTDVTPAFFLSGTDHVLINIEANGGNTNPTIGTISNAGFFNPAIQMWGALTCKFWGVNGEFGDVGWMLGGTSSVTGGAASTFVSLNQFNDVRGDYNAAHGFYMVAAAWNQFHSVTVYNNSNNGNGLYDGFYIINSSANVGNRFTTIMGGSPTGSSHIMGYYYHDAISAGLSQMDSNLVNSIGGMRQGMTYDYAIASAPFRYSIVRTSGIGGYQFRFPSRYCAGQMWVDTTVSGAPVITYSDGASTATQGGWRLITTNALSGNLLSPLTVECLGGSTAGWTTTSPAGVTSPPVTTASAVLAANACNTLTPIQQRLGNNQILSATCNAFGVTNGSMAALTVAVIGGVAASTSYAVAMQTIAATSARNVKFIVDFFNGATYLSSNTTDTGVTNSTTTTTTHALTFTTPATTNALQVRVVFTGTALNEVHYIGLISVDTHSTATIPVYA